MHKILMRDIIVEAVNAKSVSPKAQAVLNIFKNKEDIAGSLSKITLSNDEIIEVYKLVLAVGIPIVSSKNYLSSLIVSQKGPFNDAVVKTFITLITKNMNTDMVLMNFALIRKANKRISEKTKYSWVMKTQRFANRHFKEFVRNGEAATLGFDFTKEPLLRASMLNILHDHDGVLTLLSKDFEKLYAYFDTLTEDELFDFYMEANEDGISNNIKFKTWFYYPKTTARIFKHYFGKEQEHLSNTEMAKHPNCPTEIKSKMYEKTGDISFFPEDIQADIQTIFIF